MSRVLKLATDLEQKSKAQSAALEKLIGRTWGVTYQEYRNGRFLVLPKMPKSTATDPGMETQLLSALEQQQDYSQRLDEWESAFGEWRKMCDLMQRGNERLSRQVER